MIIDTEHDFQQWKVQSKSHPGTYHTVAISTKGNWCCDCLAGYFSKKGQSECHHVKIVKKYCEKLVNQTYGPNNQRTPDKTSPSEI